MTAQATTGEATVIREPHRSHRLRTAVKYTAAYSILIIFGFLMIFPFLVMLFTSFKVPADTFSYPPRLLPREQVTTVVEGFDEPLPLYNIEVDGEERQLAQHDQDCH